MNVKLKDICTINPKAPCLSDDLMVSFVPMTKVGEHGEFDPSDVKKCVDVKKGFTSFTNGDILFAKITPCMENGKGAIAISLKNGYGFGSTEFHVLRPDYTQVTSEWLYYLTSWSEFRRVAEKNMTGSAGQKRVPKLFLEKFEIDLPSLNEQKERTNILIKISKLIENRKQQLKQLDELVKARFVEMFGNVGTDEKSWRLARLGDVCKINPKKTDDTRLKSDLQVSFVPMPAVSEKGEIDSSEIKVYDEVKTGFTYFREDDVLFAKITPCMENGKGAVAKGLCNGIGFGSTEFHVLRPIENISNSYWIYAVTSFEQFRVDAASNMTGSAGQRRVPASFLESYRVSIPPIELQNEFANFVKQVDKSKFAVQKALDEAQTLFDSLMQQYFS